jgi:accessory gene regulator protein AgrB
VSGFGTLFIVGLSATMSVLATNFPKLHMTEILLGAGAILGIIIMIYIPNLCHFYLVFKGKFINKNKK